MNFIYGSSEGFEASRPSSVTSQRKVNNHSGIKVFDKNESSIEMGLTIPGVVSRPSKRLFAEKHSSHSHQNSTDWGHLKL
jgi:hypothetical protein